MTADPLRLSLTLTGGASLGAYQAGAVAALLVAVDRLRAGGTPVVVDALGGASSGSLVALFAAQCIVEGLDPADVLGSAWVDRVSLDVLRSRGSRAPLSFDGLRAQIRSALDPRDADGNPVWRVDGRQQQPVAFHVALTDLQGLTYGLDSQSGADLSATTYVDWSTFVLESGRGLEQILEPEGSGPLDAALASATNPAGFAPAILDRSGDRTRYDDHGVTNFPGSGKLWYTDGGMVQAEPVGRTLSAARQVAGDAPGRRMHIVIDPRAEGPSGSSRWSDPSMLPSWLDGLTRSLAIMPAQNVYDDLRRVVRDNWRIRDVDEAATRIAEQLGPGKEEALGALLAEITGRAPAAGSDVRDVVRTLLAELAGVDGKEVVDVELITPLVVARDSGHAVPRLLAGEFLGTFGGFLSRDLRESDFALGWDSTASWLPEGLARGGVADDAAADAAAAVDQRRDQGWREVNAGDAAARDLSPAARVALARFGVQVAKVLVASVVPDVALRAPRRVAQFLGRGTA